MNNVSITHNGEGNVNVTNAAGSKGDVIINQQSGRDNKAVNKGRPEEEGKTPEEKPPKKSLGERFKLILENTKLLLWLIAAITIIVLILLGVLDIDFLKNLL